jgi:phosphatidate cytidylyltransferase
MNPELRKRIFTSLILIFLLTAMFFYSYIMVIALITIALIIWIEFYALISKIFKKNSIKDKVFRFLCKSISLLYLSLLVYLILSIESHYIGLKIYLLYTVLVAILSDTGGLVFGKVFKGKKLTKISPKKTVSGSIGSFIFPFSLIPFFYEKFIENDLLILSLITLLISLITQVGDLFISYIKRKAKVKDTSNILPGHGGFLDRVDGIIFAIPAGVLLFNLS